MKITTSCGHPWALIDAEVGLRGYCRHCNADTEIVEIVGELAAAGRTFDQSGRVVANDTDIDPQRLVARLQRHAMGLEPNMTNTEITAARTALDQLARRPDIPPPVVPSIMVPTSISDDDALAEYLRMIE